MTRVAAWSAALALALTGVVPAAVGAAPSHYNRFHGSIAIPRYPKTKVLRTSVEIPGHPAGAYVALQLREGKGYTAAIAPKKPMYLAAPSGRWKGKAWGRVVLLASYDPATGIMHITVKLKNIDRSRRNPNAKRGHKVGLLITVSY